MDKRDAMNVPAVAQKTFEELKKQARYLSLIQLILKKLNKIHQSDKRAEYVHRLIDGFNDETFSNPTVKQLSPCKKGCTACCFSQVSVTQDEASVLAARVEAGLNIDMNRLQIQMSAKDDSADYYAIPYQDRKCIFLSDEGACRVYHDRPSVCRTNAVIGTADQCDTSETIQPTRLVKTPEADMVIYAFYLQAKSSGTLPFMLAKALGLKDH